MCHDSWVGTVEWVRSERIEVPVDDGALPCLRYEPESEVERARPVLLIPDIYGTVPFYRELSSRLAERGHPTVLMDPFWREGPLEERTREAAFDRRSRMDERRAIADASAALDSCDLIYGEGVKGVLGFCLGGLFGFVLAARRTDLVTVSYYGFPEGVPAPVRVAAPRPVDLVDDMSGPVLAFWGEDDHIEVDLMERFGEQMRSAGVDYESHIYERAGHGFLQGLVENRPDSGAAQDSWRRTLGLFDASLR